MPALNDGLLLTHLPSIARISGRPDRMLQVWLGTGTFVPTVSVDEKSLILEQVDWDDLSKSLASDIDRLSKAGRETLQITACVEGLPKASAWMLIQCYYAAFYFVQALLRICGKAPSHYGPGELTDLSTIITTYGVTPPFSLKGQILISLDQNLKTATLSKGNGGASHEATWALFAGLLEEVNVLLQSAPLSQDRYLAAEKEVTSLLKIVKPSGNALKLSTMRNNVQYRQQMGGWSPYSGAPPAEDYKRRIAASLTTRSEISDFEPTHHSAGIAFLESCLAVCFVSRHFLTKLNEMYGTSFLGAGFMKLERQYAVH